MVRRGAEGPAGSEPHRSLGRAMWRSGEAERRTERSEEKPAWDWLKGGGGRAHRDRRLREGKRNDF